MVRWADADPNLHVRHSSYYDYGAHARIMLFDHLGYGLDEFNELRLGPILFSESCQFIRELHPNRPITVNTLRGDIRADGARWTLYHEIFNHNEEKAAHIKITGAWIDLDKRKLTIPPPDMAEGLLALPFGEDYVYKKGS